MLAQQIIIGVKGELSLEEQAFLHTKLSPVTRRNYVLALRQFKQYAGITEDVAMLDPKILKQKLIEYIVHLKEAGLSYSKQNMTISAVQKLYQLHDLTGINWDNVRGYTSDDDTSRDDEPYTAQELQTLVEHASPRTKAIILTMLSAGLRIGAVPSLRMKHLQKLEDKGGLYRVLVYADSRRDRYVSFTTGECARAIDAYIKTREIAGEVIKPDSPVFRTEFDTRKNANGSVKAITKNGVYKAIEQLVVSVGIRKVKHQTELGGRRYTGTHGKPLTHSFRKIMNTSLIRAGCKPVVVELLMGHNIGLQQNYLRLSVDELCQEYCKALDMLTVSQEKQLQQEVSKLRSEISDVGMLKHDLYELREQNKWLHEKFNMILNNPRKVEAWHGVRKILSNKEQQEQD
jgi:site-specific recombinase XerD